MHELIALLLPGGDDLVAAVRRAWDAGDAVLPLDPDAPRAHLDQVMQALSPTAVVEAGGGLRRLAGGRPVEAGDALVIATSGTTGAPKGAVHTFHSVEHAAYASSTAAGVAADTRWLACLPLSHVGGFSVISRALVTGAGLDVHARADAVAIDDAAERGATHVSLVPTLLDRIDATRWRTILLGGSAIPADPPVEHDRHLRHDRDHGRGGLRRTRAQRRRGAHRGPGRPRGVATARHGPASRAAIELRSPTLLRCYRDGTDPVRPDGWYRTGDLGRVDPRTQHLTVLGRADDLIISGGEKVWPDPVEAVLRTDHRVRDVAVVGRPDPEWGERVVAVVVAEDRNDPPSLQGLRDLVRAQLPRSAAPKELELVDSLPRTGLGKIRRSLLAASGSEHHPHG